MNPILIIARRELGAFFDSLVAYIILIAFLGFSGFFTWLFGTDVFLRKQADLGVFFNWAYWTLFFFIPAITMRMLAEEKKTGTIELLLTKAVSNWQVVLGKFVACLTMVLVALFFTLPYYVTIANIGNIDHGATICGYFGLILMSAAYISIGLFASSITSNQIVAFLLALFIGVFFHFMFGLLASNMTGFLGEFFDTLSLTNHFSSIIRGVVDTKDLVYFLSVTALGLALAEQSIAKRA